MPPWICDTYRFTSYANSVLLSSLNFQFLPRDGKSLAIHGGGHRYHTIVRMCFNRGVLHPYRRKIPPPLFKKLEASTEWSQASLTAWSVVDTVHLVRAESDVRNIVRAWLNSLVRKWNRECDTESKKQNLKDEAGNITAALLPSKSPLEEFADAACRVKSGYTSVLT